MQPTLNTRGRHAMRWVLGLGLAFVVVVAMALQAARRRADERWGSVVAHWYEELERHDGLGYGRDQFRVVIARDTVRQARGGNIFRSWRQSRWHVPERADLVVRQERSFFGSHIGARMFGGMPEKVDVIRDIFGAVDVELVVEP